MLCFQLHGSRYQCHLRSTTCTFFREGKPHFSGRIVADKTDRVNLLISRPGCNHYFLTLQLTVCRKKFIQHTDDILRFLHTSLPYKMTGKLTRTRLDNMIAVRTKYLQILLSGRMSIHIEVHSRSYKHRSFRRKIGRYQHIISYPVCHFANGRGSGGSYQHRICPQSEVNVAVPRSVTLGKEFTDDRFAGQSRKRDGSNKFFSRRSNHNLHFRSLPDKSADDIASLICGNAAGNSKNYLFSF